MKAFTNPSRYLYILLPGILTVATLYACSSSGGGGVSTVTAPLGSNLKNVQLTAGTPSQIRFTYTHRNDATARGDFSINTTKTLQKISLSSTPITSNSHRFETLKLLASALVKDAFAMQQAEVTVFISTAGDPNVCSSPHAFGPFSITGAIGSALASDTTDLAPSQAVVDISNSGALEVCVVTTPPIDAFLTIPHIVVDYEPCAAAASDITGSWSGTFQCTNFGTQDDPAGSPIMLTISKLADGSYQYIDDGNAIYNGHLCGNKFKFKGGLDGNFNESGTLIFNDNNATKTSNWLSTTASGVGGSCSDSLQRDKDATSAAS